MAPWFCRSKSTLIGRSISKVDPAIPPAVLIGDLVSEIYDNSHKGTRWHDCCSVACSINRALQGNSLFDWGKSAYRRNSLHTVPKLYTWRHLETCRQDGYILIRSQSCLVSGIGVGIFPDCLESKTAVYRHCPPG